MDQDCIFSHEGIYVKDFEKYSKMSTGELTLFLTRYLRALVELEVQALEDNQLFEDIQDKRIEVTQTLKKSKSLVNPRKFILDYLNENWIFEART